jgi:hypothetical protein
MVEGADPVSDAEVRTIGMARVNEFLGEHAGEGWRVIGVSKLAYGALGPWLLLARAALTPTEEPED